MRNQILNEIYGTSKSSEIRKMILRDAKKLRSKDQVLKVVSHYTPYLWVDISPYTAKNLVADLRSDIEKSELKYKKQLLEGFALPSGFYYALQKTTQQNSKESEVIEYKKDDILKKIIQFYDIGICDDLSKYNIYPKGRETKERIQAYYLATYLAMVTGRRMIEILKTMDITKVKNDKKMGGIYIKGVAKKRSEEDEKSVFIPTLDDPKKVKNALQKLRDIFPEPLKIGEREVNKKFNYLFNKFVKTKFSDNKDDITFHTFRKIYVELAYQKFSENEEIEEFAEKVLIHDVKMLSKNYTQTSHYTNKTKGE